jgi:hypothetical protein
MEFPKYATGPAPEGGMAETMVHFMPTNYRHLSTSHPLDTFQG